MLSSTINYRIPKPRIDFDPPTYQCRYNTKPFLLDGNINKAFWADIPFTSDFVDISGPDFPAPRFRTRAKMCWDDTNLYIAALLEGDEIWGYQTERDCVIFRDNDFEVFIDPDSDTQQYYEFEMNARNTVWDLMLTKAYRDNGSPIDSWDIKGLRTAVHINGELNYPAADNSSWSVEIIFPFRSFLEASTNKERPCEGDYWRLNFSRVQWLADISDNTWQKRLGENGAPLPEDNWVWAPTGVVNIHYPELWGFLFFTAKQDTCYEIPEIERRKWVLRQLYYAQHLHWDEKKCFTRELSELTSLPLPFDVKIEITDHNFEISCAYESEILSIFADGKTTLFSC